MKRVFDVLLNDVFVGYLSESDSGYISFQFVEEYRQMPVRPILSQSFEDNLKKNYHGKSSGALPNFFANLIPEAGILRKLIEKDLPTKDDLSVLEAVGLDLPGAVVVKAGARDSYESLETTEPPNRNEANESNKETTFRFSLAGVQLKFSLDRQTDKFTFPARGHDGEWIVKLDSPRFPRLVENEFVMMVWAQTAGFEVPECALQSANSLEPQLQKFAAKNSSIFVIRRYDRDNGRRIHQEDFAQVTSQVPDKKYDDVKYEDCATLAQAIGGSPAYYEFIRRLTFIIASGNTDAHLKNWSLIYPEGSGAARLAPLYDQVFTLAWENGVEPSLGLKFAGVKRIREVDEKSFARLAGKTKNDARKTIETMHECLEKIHASWASVEAKKFLSKSHLKALRDYWSTSALLKQFDNPIN